MKNNIPLGELIEPAPLRRAGRGSFPILSMTMHGGLVDQAEKFKKRVASADTSQYKVVGRDQLVVGFPIDEGVLSFQQLYEEAVVSPAYDIWNLKNNGVNPRYLEKYLRSPRALTFYAAKLRGTTARRRTLPDDIFVKLDVPLPPIEEQRRIAEILDRAEALRTKRRAALAQLDTLTQSIFLEMFGDPATNPMRWPVKTIGEIGTVITGNTPSRENPEYFGTAIEWIKSDNINTPSYYITRATEGLSEKGKTVARTVPARSILVTCIAGSPECIGNAAMTDREVAFNQQINALVPHKADPDFVYAQIKVGKRLIRKASTDSMKGMVSKSRFETIRLLSPPTGLQREFTRRAVAIQKLKGEGSISLTTLDSLFGSLQHRAFRGEL